MLKDSKVCSAVVLVIGVLKSVASKLKEYMSYHLNHAETGRRYS